MKTLRSSHRSALSLPRCLKMRSAACLLGITLFFSVSIAAAESATITMTSGEVTQAEVLALDFGKQVRVRLGDGMEKTIPWSEIRDLKMNTSDSEAEVSAAGDLPLLEESPAGSEAAPVPVPEEQAPPAAAPAPATPASSAAKPDQSAIYNELTLVDRDISDAKADMPAIGGPITLTLVGFGIGAVVIASAANAESNCGSYCNLGPSYAIGVFNLGVGAIGAIWVGAQVAARGKQKERIGQLESKRERLKLDLQTSGSGAVGSVSLTF